MLNFMICQRNLPTRSWVIPFTHKGNNDTNVLCSLKKINFENIKNLSTKELNLFCFISSLFENAFSKVNFIFLCLITNSYNHLFISVFYFTIKYLVAVHFTVEMCTYLWIVSLESDGRRFSMRHTIFDWIVWILFTFGISSAPQSSIPNARIALVRGL